MIDNPTVLNLHCDGIDGSTTFTDSGKTVHTVTANGNAQIDTAQQKFGTGSGLFDGADDYLTIPDHADWDFGSGDFTIDLWVRFNSTSGWQTFFIQRDDYIDTKNWTVYLGSDSKLYMIFVDATIKGNYNTGVIGFNTGVWYHLAFVRFGSNGYIFVNGVAQTLTVVVSFSTNTMPNCAHPLKIGAHKEGADAPVREFNGWMDELRISKGVARWVANFTPMSEAYGANDQVSNSISIGQTVAGRNAVKHESMTQSISLGQTVFGYNSIQRISLSQSVSLGQVVAGRDAIHQKSISHSVSIGQAIGKQTVRPRTIVSVLNLNHAINLTHLADLTSVLSLGQVLDGLIEHPNTSSIIVLGQSIGVNVVRPRSIISVITLSSYPAYVTEPDVCDDPYVPSPPLGIATEFILRYPFNGSIQTLTLRNPEFGNKFTVDSRAIIRRLRGNQLVAFKYANWPTIKVQEFNFTNLTEAQADDFITFIKQSAGLEIGIRDHDNRTWRGIIVTPDNTIIQRLRGCGYDLSFQFVGAVE